MRRYFVLQFYLFDVIYFTLIPEKYFSDVYGWRSSRHTFCPTAQNRVAPSTTVNIKILRCFVGPLHKFV
jgi:hypothetical protein